MTTVEMMIDRHRYTSLLSVKLLETWYGTLNICILFSYWFQPSTSLLLTGKYTVTVVIVSDSV